MIETVGAIMLATHDMAHAVSFYRALGFELRHGRHVSAFYADVVARGYRPDAAPRDAEWGERFFHLTDPDGHELSFARLCNDGDIRLRPRGQVDVSPGIAPATVRRCAVFLRLLDSEETVGRDGFKRCQSGVVAEPCRAVGTEYRVCLAHVDIDMRVVLRRGHPDALEFPHPDPDFGDAAVVPEFRISATGRRVT
jgi:hypothetical protein